MSVGESDHAGWFVRSFLVSSIGIHYIDFSAVPSLKDVKTIRPECWTANVASLNRTCQSLVRQMHNTCEAVEIEAVRLNRIFSSLVVRQMSITLTYCVPRCCLDVLLPMTRRPRLRRGFRSPVHTKSVPLIGGWAPVSSIYPQVVTLLDAGDTARLTGPKSGKYSFPLCSPLSCLIYFPSAVINRIFAGGFTKISGDHT